jgi:hypothetical protein
VLVACSGDDDGSPSGQKDGNQAQKDGGGGGQHDGPGGGSGDGPGGTGDGPGSGPDIFVPTGCVKECYTFYDFLCVKDSTGKCRSCLNDQHCKDNPRSDGPYCDTSGNLCTCKTDADCSDRTTGLKCLVVGKYNMCTCDTAADCPAPYTICEGMVVKRCVEPCTSNADCVKGGMSGTCDTKTGKCDYPDI